MTRSTSILLRAALAAAATLGAASAANAVVAIVPAPVAEYDFGNTLASSVAGAPALTATDPLGLSGFGTDTVFGSSRTVYNFNGTGLPTSDQAGLSLDASSLITNPSVYSIEMVFQFTQNPGGWRRIIDVDSRQSDDGFYVNPNGTLDIYPVAGGAAFTNNVYHDVFLVDNNGVATFYLDGSAQATVTTNVMDLQPGQMINFFLDNVVAGGQGEYSSGSIAQIKVYNAALDTAPAPSIPEPETFALMLLGLGVITVAARRRR